MARLISIDGSSHLEMTPRRYEHKGEEWVMCLVKAFAGESCIEDYGAFFQKRELARIAREMTKSATGRQTRIDILSTEPNFRIVVGGGVSSDHPEPGITVTFIRMKPPDFRQSERECKLTVTCDALLAFAGSLATEIEQIGAAAELQ